MRVQSGIAPARPARPAPRSAFMAAATSTPVSTAEPAPLSMSTPVEPAPRGPQPRAGESGTWFEAPCASGSVRLCVGPDAPAAQHAAEAAILLRHVEPLLAAMDDWAGTECAWRWAAAPAQGAADSVATVRWRGGSRDRHCVLSWPWALLRSLPAPPPELAARLDWPLVASVLVLARSRRGRAGSVRPTSLHRRQPPAWRWTCPRPGAPGLPAPTRWSAPAARRAMRCAPTASCAWTCRSA